MIRPWLESSASPKSGPQRYSPGDHSPQSSPPSHDFRRAGSSVCPLTVAYCCRLECGRTRLPGREEENSRISGSQSRKSLLAVSRAPGPAHRAPAYTNLRGSAPGSVQRKPFAKARPIQMSLAEPVLGDTAEDGANTKEQPGRGTRGWSSAAESICRNDVYRLRGPGPQRRVDGPPINPYGECFPAKIVQLGGIRLAARAAFPPWPYNWPGPDTAAGDGWLALGLSLSRQ